MAEPPAPVESVSLGVLIADVSRLLRRDFDRRVRHLGLSQAQWRVLARLSRHEGINQATLADLLDIQPITLTRLLDRMQAAGWLERRPDSRDRRAVCLHLMPKAQPLLEELQRIGEVTRGVALDGIDAAERRRLTVALLRMKLNLAAAVVPADEDRDDAA
ncbi:MAG: MarR family transcriptional regulator [Geminicoccaceae bacterium]